MKRYALLGLTVAFCVILNLPARVKAQQRPDSPETDLSTYQTKVLPFLRKTCFGLSC